MKGFEDFKSNLDLIDKYGLQQVKVDKSVIHRGDFELIKKKPLEHLGVITPLVAGFIGLNNTAEPLPENDPYFRAYTHIDAQTLYLLQKPTCFLILGKPGLDFFSIGEKMAIMYNCIHLHPKILLQDEIDQGSLTGKCLEFNLRHNKVCKSQVLFELLKQKLKSPAIQHRGYVISGFPLVSCEPGFKFLTTSMYSEESYEFINEILSDLIVLSVVKKKKKKRGEGEQLGEGEVEEEEEEEAKIEEEELPEEEEDGVVELPKFILNTCSNVVVSSRPHYETMQTLLIHQISELFSLETKPNYIIYLSCPDADDVILKSHKLFDFSKKRYVMKPFDEVHEQIWPWPPQYSIRENEPEKEKPMKFEAKHACRQPLNFEKKSIYQICNYNTYALPSIKTHMEAFLPKYIIKFDGLLNINEIMSKIGIGLLKEPVHIIPIPEPLYLDEPPEDLEEFWEMIKTYNVVTAGDVKFNKYPSLWFERCPVELKNRVVVQGKPKYAVAYFRHVYLLSSLPAMVKFCLNPRPYLKPEYLLPTGRIMVLGTKSTGKTMVSQCLSWILDAPIVNYDTLYGKLKDRKYKVFASKILKDMLPSLQENRLKAWEVNEQNRIERLNEWLNKNSKSLKTYVALHEKFSKSPDDEDVAKKMKTIGKHLADFPFLKDIAICKKALHNKDILLKNAPTNLANPAPAPPRPRLEDPDVSEAVNDYIVSNDLQKDVEPEASDIAKKISEIINDFDEKAIKASNGEILHGKWIFDGVPPIQDLWESLKDMKMLPDNTFSITESREIDSELIAKYDAIEKSIKNHEERFRLVKDPLIGIMQKISPLKENTVYDVQVILKDLLSTVLDLIPGDDTDADKDLESRLAEKIELYSTAIAQYRENWDNAKLSLEESFKSYAEIELETQSDIDILQEVLLKLRVSYFPTSVENEDEIIETEETDNEDKNIDYMTHNDPIIYGDVNKYCPIAYNEHNVLWEGKNDYIQKYQNQIYKFCNEDFPEKFANDPNIYVANNKPYRPLPPLRICVVGSIGSGKTTISKNIAKELGLYHIDFSDFINEILPKHFKKVGRKFENPLKNEAEEAANEAVTNFVEAEEATEDPSNILSNGPELRRLINNYYENGSPFPSNVMEILIKRIWFENPFNCSKGFVLDGFPRLTSDVEDMIACFCIPDLIIELECDSTVALERLIPEMINTWKSQLAEAKRLNKLQKIEAKLKWNEMVCEKVVIKLIYDEIVDKAYYKAEPLARRITDTSMMIDANPDAGLDMDTSLFTTYNAVIEEFPEPKDETEWPQLDEYRENLETRLETLFETDDENVKSLQEVVEEQNIKMITIDGGIPLNKVLRNIYHKISYLRDRNISFLEQTFIIEKSLAEMCLLEGYFVVSIFHRMCPVYIYENPHCFANLYHTFNNQVGIFTVAHRGFIYFLFGAENVMKFRSNPLKYIKSDLIANYYPFQLRIGIIGPPKCGKSTLTKKIATSYGLLPFSRGKAIRNVLCTMHWTTLAQKIRKQLIEGKMVDFDLIIQAIKVAVMNQRSNTNGFVFDGFPCSAAEAMHLEKEGLYPFIIIDVNASKNRIIENSQNEIYYDIYKLTPPYCKPLIDLKFTKWEESKNNIRDWINGDYQNMFILDGEESRWQCIQNVKNMLQELIKKIHYYNTHVKEEIVEAGHMCISNKTMQKKITQYKNFCPVCLQNQKIRYSDFPVDKKGLVHYKNKYYWICAEHMNMVLNNPQYYLKSYDICIPEVPCQVKNIDKCSIYENGICVVTYAENLPSQRIKRGSNQFAASYNGKTYLLCSRECLNKFLEEPHLYCDISVFDASKLLPQLSLSKLPNLGYLEQTLGNLLTEGCCYINAVRPKYPGLSIDVSGLILLALFLKTRNPKIKHVESERFQKAKKVYEARCKLLIEVGLQMRSMDNPFASYPKCCISDKEKMVPVPHPSKEDFFMRNIEEFNSVSED